MANGEAHQGVCALAFQILIIQLRGYYSVQEKKRKILFLVILDEIEDPHNFGAIIRSCEGAGVHGIIVSKKKPSTCYFCS